MAITPCAGYVNGAGALLIGAIDSTIVWMAWTYLSRASFMRRVDDAMGIIYTHGIAGFFGGILLGVFADPSVVVYHYVAGVKGPVAITGALYGHPKQDPDSVPGRDHGHPLGRHGHLPHLVGDQMGDALAQVEIR